MNKKKFRERFWQAKDLILWDEREIESLKITKNPDWTGDKENWKKLDWTCLAFFEDKTAEISFNENAIWTSEIEDFKLISHELLHCLLNFPYEEIKKSSLSPEEKQKIISEISKKEEEVVLRLESVAWEFLWSEIN